MENDALEVGTLSDVAEAPPADANPAEGVDVDHLLAEANRTWEVLKHDLGAVWRERRAGSR